MTLFSLTKIPVNIGISRLFLNPIHFLGDVPALLPLCQFLPDLIRKGLKPFQLLALLSNRLVTYHGLTNS